MLPCGLILFQPNVIGDDRGFFMETFCAHEFKEWGLPTDFVQDNHSKSAKGVLRGMHFQWNEPQGKLLRVISGSGFVAEIDLRYGSPTQGKWFSFELTADNKNILWIPPGFANGFTALSEVIEVQYKCTARWNPNGENGILWNDPEIGIKWPIENPVLSNKDMQAISFSEWLSRDESHLFEF
jgi:dTDP-4-dehydrorhamnose 3,5-epimerase